MKKIKLNKEIAERFCYEYNIGDFSGIDYLRKANNQCRFLDGDTDRLLYSVLAMNIILNDYLWENTLNTSKKEAQPTFTEDWLYDLEEKYFDSKNKLLNRFNNIKFNESGELEVTKEV